MTLWFVEVAVYFALVCLFVCFLGWLFMQVVRGASEYGLRLLWVQVAMAEGGYVCKAL